MTSLLSMTKIRSFDPKETVVTVGSNPGIPEDSGSGPDAQADAVPSASAAMRIATAER